MTTTPSGERRGPFTREGEARHRAGSGAGNRAPASGADGPAHPAPGTAPSDLLAPATTAEPTPAPRWRTITDPPLL